MRIFDDAVRIEVNINLPWTKKEIPPYWYAIDYRQAREALTPLPRGREIDPWSTFEA